MQEWYERIMRYYLYIIYLYNIRIQMNIWHWSYDSKPDQVGWLIVVMQVLKKPYYFL